VRLFSSLFACRLATLTALAIFSCGLPATAGWYQVENYEGEIDGRPVQLSLQRYSFGSGITIEGSYYFETERQPVALYGALKGHQAALCEISSDAELRRVVVMGSKTPFDLTSCPLVLSFDGDRAAGTWKRNGVGHAVALKKTGSLNDTREATVDGEVVIPFWAQTQTHMFAGYYEKSTSGLCMSRMTFINKASGKVDQELRYDGDPCDAGMIMTPIYMNVQLWIETGREIVSINFRDGGAGYSEDYVYDSSAKRYVKKR
jgi:hypothetical protein